MESKSSKRISISSCSLVERVCTGRDIFKTRNEETNENKKKKKKRKSNDAKNVSRQNQPARRIKGIKVDCATQDASISIVEVDKGVAQANAISLPI